MTNERLEEIATMVVGPGRNWAEVDKGLLEVLESERARRKGIVASLQRLEEGLRPGDKVVGEGFCFKIVPAQIDPRQWVLYVDTTYQLASEHWIPVSALKAMVKGGAEIVSASVEQEGKDAR